MNTQDLLCQSNPLVDTFSFLLLTVPGFRVSDALTKEHLKAFLTPRQEGCRFPQREQTPLHVKDWMTVHNLTERALQLQRSYFFTVKQQWVSWFSSFVRFFFPLQ